MGAEVWPRYASSQTYLNQKQLDVMSVINSNYNIDELGILRSLNSHIQMCSYFLCIYARITHTNSLWFICIRSPQTFIYMFLIPFICGCVCVGRLASGFFFSCSSFGEACQPYAVVVDWLWVGDCGSLEELAY